MAGRHVPAWAAAVRSQGCVAHTQLVKPARSPTTPFVNRTPSHPAPPSSCSGLTKDGACVPCNGNEDGGVMDCDAAGKATDCYGGWFLKGGACVKCSEHCSDCTDEKTCNSCECGGGAGSGRGRGGGGAQFSVTLRGAPGCCAWLAWVASHHAACIRWQVLPVRQTPRLFLLFSLIIGSPALLPFPRLPAAR